MGYCPLGSHGHWGFLSCPDVFEPGMMKRISIFVADQTHRPRIPTGFRLKAQGCARRAVAKRRREARAALGHRPPTAPTAALLRPFPSRASKTSATTPLALFSFPCGPKVAPIKRGNLGLKDTIPLGLSNRATSQNLRCAHGEDTETPNFKCRGREQERTENSECPCYG